MRARRPRRGCGAELAQDRRDVVVDRLARQEQPLGDVAVAQAVGDQREHLELARGELGRVLARRRPRPARQRARAALAQLAADDRRRAAGAERQQLLEPAAAQRFVLGAGARERRLVRAAQRGPVRGGLLGFAGELERVGLGDRRSRASLDARAPARQRELADDPAASRLSASASTTSVSVTTRAGRRPARRPRRRRRRPARSAAAPAPASARASSSGDHGPDRRGARAAARSR